MQGLQRFVLKSKNAFKNIFKIKIVLKGYYNST